MTWGVLYERDLVDDDERNKSVTGAISKGSKFDLMYIHNFLSMD